MAFRHTRYAVYLTTGLSFLCVFYASSHTLSTPCLEGEEEEDQR